MQSACRHKSVFHVCTKKYAEFHKKMLHRIYNYTCRIFSILAQNAGIANCVYISSEKSRTTADHDISGRTSAVGPGSGERDCPTRCVDNPRPQAYPDGRSDCSPNTRRPQSPTQTHERCSSFGHCWPDEPSPHDIRTWKQQPSNT